MKLTIRDHYAIVPEDDGETVSVYLRPEMQTYHTDTGVLKYDCRVRVIRGVIPWDGLEDDIRARFDAWCETAEVIDL